MASHEADHFKLWETSLFGESSLELPADPLDDIIEQSIDPVDCARSLHRYAWDNPTDAHSLLIRRGLSKLGHKYNGQYLTKQLTVTADGAFAVPDLNEITRKRDIFTTSQYEGTVHAIGNLWTFGTEYYRNPEDGDERTLITLRLKEPYLLDAEGQIVTHRQLPDYMLIPIPRVLSYSFETKE
ncbi:hypothetical protein KDA14_06075 [Candidatus Saccharibacteria bacterium]|nr:hypothetical protein [Candidatus Saccharibacteria bacterium]